MGRQMKPYKFKFGRGVILKGLPGLPGGRGVSRATGSRRGRCPRGAASRGAAPVHRSSADLGLSQGDKPRPLQRSTSSTLYQPRFGNNSYAGGALAWHPDPLRQVEPRSVAPTPRAPVLPAP